MLLTPGHLNNIFFICFSILCSGMITVGYKWSLVGPLVFLLIFLFFVQKVLGQYIELIMTWSLIICKLHFTKLVYHNHALHAFGCALRIFLIYRPCVFLGMHVLLLFYYDS